MDQILKISPVVLFFAFFVKIGVLGASIPEVAALAVGAGLVIALEFRGKDTKIQALEDKITALHDQAAVQTEEIKSIRSYVTTQKMSQVTKGMNVR